MMMKFTIFTLQEFVYHHQKPYHSLFARKCRKMKDCTCLWTLKKDGHYAVSISTKNDVLREGELDLSWPLCCTLKRQWYAMVWYVWLKMNQSLIVASTRRPNQAFLSQWQCDQHAHERSCLLSGSELSQ